MKTSIDEILEAFRDWAEADAELKQAQSEYTGYSPSYHLASWYQREEKSREQAAKALDAYIQERIEAVLAGREVTNG